MKAEGTMGDLDDGPTQEPLDEKELEEYILKLLPDTHFDLILTHDAKGEYTRHLRHEEVNNAVVTLWKNGKITSDELWTFAYEDGNKAYFPQAIEKANLFEILPEQIWTKKYKLITKTYGFGKDSWEAETTPVSEAFWQFKESHATEKTITKKEKELNIFKTPNLDALKSMYFKSKVYISDKISWEKELSLLSEAFIQLKDPDNAKNTLNYIEAELKIFKAPSIEVLKSMYYSSIGTVFNKQSWELEIQNLKETFSHYDKMQFAKLSFVRLGKELTIFKSPSIEILKKVYNKSIGLVLHKDAGDIEPISISNTFRHFHRNHFTKKTLDKIGQELQLFNKPSIENLKLLYAKTSNFLEGSLL
jgi:hypothetical protein